MSISSRKRTGIVVVTTLALVFSTMVAVTSASAAKDDWNCKPTKAKPVTIRMIEFFAGPARTPLLNAFARQYEAKNPGVKIELISPSQADSAAKITQLLQAKNVDIIEPAAAILGQALSANQLANIYPYFSKTKAFKALTPYSKYLATIYGKKTLYMIPSGYYTKASFVRTEIFKAAGVAIPKTWTDIYNAKKIQKDNSYIYAMRGARASFTQALFITWAYNAPNLSKGGMYTKDGKISMFATPEAQAALDMLMKIWKEASPAASIGWGYPEMVQGFVDGVANYLIQDNEVIQIVDEKYAPFDSGKWIMAQIPKGPTGYSAQTIGGGGWSVTASSPCKNIAAGFLDYITQDPQHSSFARAYGVGPVTTTAAKDTFFKTGPWAVYSKIALDPKEIKLDASETSKPCYGEFFVLADKDMQDLYSGAKTTSQVLKEWAAFWEGAKCK